MSQYYYLVQAFEAGVVKIWGKESNLKRGGGGKESKFIEEYTPLLISIYLNHPISSWLTWQSGVI
jgi:hypothetical protein